MYTSTGSTCTRTCTCTCKSSHSINGDCTTVCTCTCTYIHACVGEGWVAHHIHLENAAQSVNHDQSCLLDYPITVLGQIKSPLCHQYTYTHIITVLGRPFTTYFPRTCTINRIHINLRMCHIYKMMDITIPVQVREGPHMPA